MAGKVGKRKSESALPTGRSKQQKAVASRGDDSDSGRVQDESDDPLFVQQEPVAAKYVKKSTIKSRKSEPVKRAPRVDEYEEDEGRMEGQQFLALVEFESKKKKRAAEAANKYLERLGDTVSRSEDSLLKNLRDLNAESARRDTDFKEAFEDAYAASRPLPISNRPARNSSEELSFASLYNRSQEVVQSAQAIIEKYEVVSAKAASIETSRLMDNNWGDEDDQVAKILAVGHEVMLNKYEAMLQGYEEPIVEGENVEYVGMLYKPNGEDKSMPWGKIAKKQEKSARKLYRSIAVEAS